jgi:hypothetical protein
VKGANAGVGMVAPALAGYASWPACMLPEPSVCCRTCCRVDGRARLMLPLAHTHNHRAGARFPPLQASTSSMCSSSTSPHTRASSCPAAR